jgi:peroxiredoxin
MPLTVGMVSPEFVGYAGDGQAVTLSEGLSPWTLLVFWKPGCQASRVALGILEEWHRADGSHLQVIGVAQETRRGEGQEVAREAGVTFPIVDDAPDYPISWADDPAITPTVFFIDPERRTVVQRCEGFERASYAALLDAIVRSLGRVIPAARLQSDTIPDHVPG